MSWQHSQTLSSGEPHFSTGQRHSSLDLPESDPSITVPLRLEPDPPTRSPSIPGTAGLQWRPGRHHVCLSRRALQPVTEGGKVFIFSTLDDRLQPHIVDKCNHVVCWHHYFCFTVLLSRTLPLYVFMYGQKWTNECWEKAILLGRSWSRKQQWKKKEKRMR